MCKADVESIDHLFLHCPIAYDLWSFGFLGSGHVSFVGKVHLGGNRVMKFGQQFRIVYCGVYGGREIQGFFRIVIEALLISDCSSYEHSLIG